MRNLLDELERLEAAATPGPWEFWHGYGIAPPGGTDRGVQLSFDSPDCEDHDDPDDCHLADCHPPGNTALVIAARNALPKLLRVARAAQRRAQLDRMHRAEPDESWMPGDEPRQVNELEIVDGLQAALDALNTPAGEEG